MKSFNRHPHVAGLCATLILLSAIASASAADHPLPVTAEIVEDRIVVRVDGAEFTSYLFGDHLKYPFFHPVNGPKSGRSVTTWGQEPYPHHSSLYISLDRVKCDAVPHANYWQPRNNLATGQIISTNAEIVSQDGHQVTLRDHTKWVVPSSNTHQLSDVRTITITAPSPEIRIMDFRFDITPEKDLEVGQTGHSFFSVRMCRELSVGCARQAKEWAELGTGTVVNSHGAINEEGAREQPADWCAAFGTHAEHSEGLAIIQDPGNPMGTAKWFIRNYGFMSPTPFAFDGNRNLKRGETLTFQYRVVVFAGDLDSADLPQRQKDFTSKLSPAPTE